MRATSGYRGEYIVLCHTLLLLKRAERSTSDESRVSGGRRLKSELAEWGDDRQNEVSLCMSSAAILRFLKGQRTQYNVRQRQREWHRDSENNCARLTNELRGTGESLRAAST